MDLQAFHRFLRRNGRSESAADRGVRYVDAYALYLDQQCDGIPLGEAGAEELQGFVDRVDEALAKKHLWGLTYYFEFSNKPKLAFLARQLRQQRISRQAFKLGDFRGVNQQDINRLSAAGIKTVVGMLNVGQTAADREALSKQTGVAIERVIELLKLSDLSRIQGLKAIRARLYYDAGIDTIETLAQWEPEEMRATLVTFVEQTGFDGIPPQPKEAASAVSTARKLPVIVQF